MDKEMIAKMVIERLTAWEKSQKGQTNGYEYEKTFVEMMQKIEKEIFNEMSGTKTQDKNKKKQF
jgi:hypothetical protein